VSRERRSRGGSANLLLLVAAWGALGAGYEWGGPAARGLRELREKKPHEAIGSFQEARSERPRAAAIRFDQALAFQAAGAADSARVAYRDALELEGAPARAAAAYNLANEALRDGRVEDAIAGYRASLREDPSRPDAKRNLEEALRRSRRASPTPRRGSSGQEGTGSGGSGAREGGASPPPRDGAKGAPQPPSGAPSDAQRAIGTSTPTREDAEHWLDALEAERRASRSQEQANRRAARPERRTHDW
jgi:tetratricopeptide (TPR) repeat protein